MLGQQSAAVKEKVSQLEASGSDPGEEEQMVAGRSCSQVSAGTQVNKDTSPREGEAEHLVLRPRLCSLSMRMWKSPPSPSLPDTS